MKLLSICEFFLRFFCEFSLPDPVLKLFLILIFVKKNLSKKTWICDKYYCFCTTKCTFRLLFLVLCFSNSYERANCVKTTNWNGVRRPIYLNILGKLENGSKSFFCPIQQWQWCASSRLFKNSRIKLVKTRLHIHFVIVRSNHNFNGHKLPI